MGEKLVWGANMEKTHGGNTSGESKKETPTWEKSHME